MIRFSTERRTLAIDSLDETMVPLMRFHSGAERGPSSTVKIYETSEELMKDFGGDK